MGGWGWQPRTQACPLVMSVHLSKVGLKKSWVGQVMCTEWVKIYFLYQCQACGHSAKCPENTKANHAYITLPIPVSVPWEAASQAQIDCLPLKLSQEVKKVDTSCLQLEKFLQCAQNAPRWCCKGCVALGPRKSSEYKGQRSQGKCDLKFDYVAQNSTQGRWCPSGGYLWGGLHIAIMANVPLASPWRQTTKFFHLSLAHI